MSHRRVRLEPAAEGPALPGRVTRIEPAGFTKLSSLGIEQQRVNVRIAFVDPPAGLGVGYRVQARFITGSRADADIVPRHSVMEDADRSPYVLKVVDGRVRRQPIRVGLRGDLAIEVLEGVSPSDVIVARPDTALADGDPVRARALPE